ncbi:CPBP family intramembrane glutamic endopeptidase [Balneola vulgaris]|uniref:CPBP family intramembrane glutamic endopeptidase n=1 Tax=Balneola vulgaris TaxID=287535 RepID=UPI0003765CD6|nr:CPBP family intramembrane glutamic endopeptidase [Balneola vulgaris]
MSEQLNTPTSSIPEYEEDLRPWVERNGFAHWAIAVLWFIIAFFLFQIIGGLIGALLLLPELMQAVQSGGDIQAIISANLDIAFIGNTAGQFLIIGLASYYVAKLHSIPGKHRQFLRLQLSPNVWKITAITAILVVVIMPFNGFLGWLNYLIFDSLVQVFPSLNWFVETQDSMSEMIKGFIGTENAVLLAFIHIGIVPSLFEEVMFRGYIQRALEKSWGIMAGILISGILFGMYHIQPSNLIPLSVLGILFAYITYVSNSLIPAMVAHLINNGGQVLYGSMNKEFLEMEMTRELDISPLIIIASMILSAGLIYLLRANKNKEAQHV